MLTNETETKTVLIPVRDFDWDENFTGEMHELTCNNHRSLKWMTKHYYDRALFYYGEKGTGRMSTECDCTHGDLRVVVTYK